MKNGKVIALALLVLLALVFVWVFRQQGKIEIQGPFGIGAKLDGSNQPAPGVRGEGLESKAGGIEARDKTGKGVELKNSSARKDIRLENAAPQGDPQPPKR